MIDTKELRELGRTSVYYVTDKKGSLNEMLGEAADELDALRARVQELEQQLAEARELIKKYDEAIEEHRVQSAKDMVMAKDFHLYAAIEAAKNNEEKA